MPDSDDLQPDPPSPSSRSPPSSTSLTPSSPPSDPPPLPDVPASPPNPSSRKPSRKKPKPLSDKRRAAVQQKLDLLSTNFRPVPFAPSVPLDFAPHERLFRTLSLWDFAHLDLSSPLRTDLLAQLIANYDPPSRLSRVSGFRINVSRPDLARALSLSPKKEIKEAGPDLLSSEESISVLLDFLSTHVVLHEEDACILPGEVVAATQLVREGHANKVDWAGLLWTMAERELIDSPVSGSCYYASHLQRLMQHQKPGIFEEAAQEQVFFLRPCDDVTMDEVGLLQSTDPVLDPIMPFKKARTEEVTAELCMEEAQSWLEKAKTALSQREEVSAAAQLQAQYLSGILQEKDRHIRLLENVRLEEQQRRDMEICQVEHELSVMAKIIQGYRKALRETRLAFAEYRKKYPQGEERLYVDDGDGLGGVLSAKERERRRAAEEEERETAMKMVRSFEDAWGVKFEELERSVVGLEGRLSRAEEEVGSLRR